MGPLEGKIWDEGWLEVGAKNLTGGRFSAAFSRQGDFDVTQVGGPGRRE